ncbi:unnamed protein product [Schistosoma curassoni]|uniref:MKLP1_Arf_bdg domain-containing protein n=1 Tax=Schistosoma curassoni TaxID=6186 RepID=A0A183KPQ0_9TREM|nr:unnamed protein product [Schistosoma curassoni]
MHIRSLGIQTNHNHSNNKSPIELNDNNNNLSSIDSFSHFTSVSENHYPPLTSIHLSKKLRKSKFIDKNQLNDPNHLINKKSIKQNNQYLLTDKANLRKIKKQTNKSQLRNLLSNHQSLFNDQSDNNNDDNDDDDNIDERKVVDVRQLNRTRSGRIVIPKLDARYEQSVVLNRGHVMGVSRNTDDEVCSNCYCS